MLCEQDEPWRKRIEAADADRPQRRRTASRSARQCRLPVRPDRVSTYELTRPTDRPSAPSITDQEALQFHSRGRPGKLEIVPTKPMATQRDLSLAYSPGVAVPVKAIAADPSTAYDYTARGNMVAVITNGTAILGLGNLGALAAKPVMEGKAVLFKRFADVDSIDLEVETEDPDEFINAVKYLGPSFGGHQSRGHQGARVLLHRGAPARVDGHSRLSRRSARHRDHRRRGHDQRHAPDRPRHQDDAARLQRRGRGGHRLPRPDQGDGLRAGERHAVRHQGRRLSRPQEGMNQWKSAHAVDTPLRTLEEAMVGADIFFGLSAKGALTAEMVKSMAPNPIIFAMANPDPEITPEEAKKARDDVIIATGRSDYPNQVNNVLGFPYIFRGALDVRAKTINMEMKIAAAHALAELAREDVPDEVAAAYRGARPRFGRDYIIPVPFDPRLIHVVPIAVAKAAMDSGVARRPIVDMDAYKAQLSARRDPIAGAMQRIVERVRRMPKRVVFAEGEEEQVIRAAYSFVNQGLGDGDPGRARGARARRRQGGGPRSRRQGHRDPQRPALAAQCALRAVPLRAAAAEGLPVPRLPAHDQPGPQLLRRRDGRAGRRGRDGDRRHPQFLDRARRGPARDRRQARPSGGRRFARPGARPARSSSPIPRSPKCRPPRISPRSRSRRPGVARRLGYEPRVAMLAFSNFGHPPGERTQRVQEAVRILDAKRVDFEYDGEMGADVALNRELMAAYPFCRLTDTANVLIMPAFHSASISTRMLQELGGATVIGPLIVGLEKPVQIVSLGAKDSDIVNMAALASFNIGGLNPRLRSRERLGDARYPTATVVVSRPQEGLEIDRLRRPCPCSMSRSTSRPSLSRADDRRASAPSPPAIAVTNF